MCARAAQPRHSGDSVWLPPGTSCATFYDRVGSAVTGYSQGS